MNFATVEKIAAAILYEGYILYPYRPTAIKNRQRWNFGTLYPRVYAEARQPKEPFRLVAECVVATEHAAPLDLKLSFLQLMPPARADDVALLTDPSLAWEQAMERSVEWTDLAFADVAASPRSFTVEQHGLQIEMIVAAEFFAEGACKLRVEVQNATSLKDGPAAGRAEALPLSLVSAHLLLGLKSLDEHWQNRRSLDFARDDKVKVSDFPGQQLSRREGAASDFPDQQLSQEVDALTFVIPSEAEGPAVLPAPTPTPRRAAFVSLLDPEPKFRQAATSCHNIGVFPVLAGEEPDRSIMLCSPIILYDYPKIAPESEGDFFDGTEMDEMLTLRVLTLTDAEKQEMRNGDPRARKILERTEALTPDAMLKAHGVIRELRQLRGGAS